MSQVDTNRSQDCVPANTAGSSSVVLVCEHASYFIPPEFNDLGLLPADLKSHATWDPGAMAVAMQMSNHLDAVLVASPVSRLVYDCNRPPNAPDAMPARSELINVPGNQDLTPSERNARVDAYYRPFQQALCTTVRRVEAPVLVTIHSFTASYFGQQRTVEIGILHDSDTRLADMMMRTADRHTSAQVRRNEPYGPEHGVTHTLKEHALTDGHLNVMVEIRNDLIETTGQQAAMAAMLSTWIVDACAQLDVTGNVQCQT